jgi:predicted dehydrogenase/threonine dehydrogenase-like Zn-dependent dehydrogenase
MKQLTQNFKNGELKIEEVPVPAIKPGGLLVRNNFSLISAGTERMFVDLGQKSIVGKARSRPDLVKQVMRQVKRDGLVNTYRKVMDRMDSLMTLGYSSSGVVEAVDGRVNGYKTGDMVACAGAGYANHAEVVFVPQNLCVRIPEGVRFEDAAFTTVGAIALQGVRRAEPRIGEKVVVIGLGLVGQITVQILKANGCKVLGIDIDPEKAGLARKLGADKAVTTDQAHEVCSSFSAGLGADSVIITAATKSDEPITMAGELSREQGTVVVVGAVGMGVPRDIYYKKELDLRLSRSYGPGRYDSNYEQKGIDYPISYVRWTEKRNMEEFLHLVNEGKVTPGQLVTHTFNFDHALKAYDIITGKVQEKYLAVLLKYDTDSKLERKVWLDQSVKTKRKSVDGQVNIGVIGAGNFASGVLLPKLRSLKSVRIKCIATATGLSAAHIGKRFHCDYVTSDYKEIVSDPDLHAITIATRHNLHSEIAIAGLKEGKYVFLEKPLAISTEQLYDIVKTWRDSSGNIMVGFNRRFAPSAVRVKEHFRDRNYPLSINYRVNAGAIPKDSWIHDPEEGGGRIIGEVCHFVDFLQYMAGCYPKRVFAEILRDENSSDETYDNLSLIISFPDGSVGVISYLANGSSQFPKERIEVFGGGSVCIIDDFGSVEIITGSGISKFSDHQDKGHSSELQEFAKAVENGSSLPVDFHESVVVTMTTFRIIDSIRSGSPEEVNLDLIFKNDE